MNNICEIIWWGNRYKELSDEYFSSENLNERENLLEGMYEAVNLINHLSDKDKGCIKFSQLQNDNQKKDK